VYNGETGLFKQHLMMHNYEV